MNSAAVKRPIQKQRPSSRDFCKKVHNLSQNKCCPFLAAKVHPRREVHFSFNIVSKLQIHSANSKFIVVPQFNSSGNDN